MVMLELCGVMEMLVTAVLDIVAECRAGRHFGDVDSFLCVLFFNWVSLCLICGFFFKFLICVLYGVSFYCV